MDRGAAALESMCRQAFTVLVLLVGVAALSTAQSNPTPIPQQPEARAVAPFVGQPAVAHPIAASLVPQNPFMMAGSWSNIHGDSYMSDTYVTGGPLGRSPQVLSTFLGTPTASGLAVVMVFGQDQRLLAGITRVDIVDGTVRSYLVVIDPTTLRTLAALLLPSPPAREGRSFRPAGAYFYLDQFDRIVVGTADRTVWVVSHGATTLRREATYDLTGLIPPEDSIQALQPDFSGHIWLTTKGGLVATLDSSGTVLGALRLEGERIANSHAADETGGVFIASTQAMYRFDALPSGAPAVTWRETYDAGTHVKSGQVDIGTGTTPTLMGTEYVTITDNADPQMHVLVYRRSRKAAGARLVCAEPVFKPGSGSTENSLVATYTSIVVENNFGYKSINDTENGRTTKPGLTRIDVAPWGCHTAWSNEQESTPTLVTKMSVANGLIYTYTKPKGPANTDAWYFTAIDFETGETIYKQLAGTGTFFNNHYSAIYLGPDGRTAYVGVLGGIVAMRDTY